MVAVVAPSLLLLPMTTLAFVAPPAATARSSRARRAFAPLSVARREPPSEVDVVVIGSGSAGNPTRPTSPPPMHLHIALKAHNHAIDTSTLQTTARPPHTTTTRHPPPAHPLPTHPSEHPFNHPLASRAYHVPRCSPHRAGRSASARLTTSSEAARTSSRSGSTVNRSLRARRRTTRQRRCSNSRRAPRSTAG